MLAWVMAGAMVLGAPALKDVPKPPKTPEGRWTVERWERDGQVWERNSLQGYVVIFTAKTCSTERNGVSLGTETTEFRETGGVKQVDFRGDGFAGVKKGIWKVDADTLTLCESEAGGERPTDYTAPTGSKRQLLILKRIKD